MPRRGEQIRKRKDGRWEGRFKAGCDRNGKTVYRSVYAKTYAEVKEKLHTAWEAQAAPRVKSPLLKDVLGLWQKVNEPNRKGATNMKYDDLIQKHILPELGAMEVSSLNTAILTDFMNQKLASGRLDSQTGLSASYVRSMMLILDSALRFAEGEHLCPPFYARVHKPTIHKNEVEVLDPETQRALELTIFEHLNETTLGVYLSLQTGLRIGEVCALRWRDIDLQGAVLHVRATVSRVVCSDGPCKSTLIIDIPKTPSSLRDIPISSKLLAILSDMGVQNGESFVLSSCSRFVSPRTYEYRFHRLLQSANIQPFHYHILRHTFATRCVDAGVDIKSLSEILGHSNVSITLNTYVHPSMDRKREQLEKLSCPGG